MNRRSFLSAPLALILPIKDGPSATAVTDIRGRGELVASGVPGSYWMWCYKNKAMRWCDLEGGWVDWDE